MPDERGYNEIELRKREAERMDAMPLRTACALCQWEYLGTVLEGRERARAHRLEAHPEAVRTRRRPTHHQLKSFRQHLTPEDEAEIMAERDRRNRLLGVDIG